MSGTRAGQAITAITPMIEAHHGLTTQILAGDALMLGRAVSGRSAAVAQVVGLASGGALVGAIGPQPALIVTTACCLLAALTVRRALPGTPHPAGPATGAAMRSSWNGGRRPLADRTVRRLLLAQRLPTALGDGLRGAARAARRRPSVLVRRQRPAHRASCRDAVRPPRGRPFRGPGPARANVPTDGRPARRATFCCCR
jgi:hypothetical protein